MKQLGITNGDFAIKILKMGVGQSESVCNAFALLCYSSSSSMATFLMFLEPAFFHGFLF